jgi:hypothetical protein
MKIFFLIPLVIFMVGCTKNDCVDPSCQKKCSQNFSPIPCELLPPNGAYYDASQKQCILVYDCENVPPFKTLEECEACMCK